MSPPKRRSSWSRSKTYDERTTERKRANSRAESRDRMRLKNEGQSRPKTEQKTLG